MAWRENADITKLKVRDLTVWGTDNIAENGPGDKWYVDSGVGASNDGKTWAGAFITLAEAIAAATASNGDKIYVAEGHAETVATAGAITFGAKIGTRVIGMGEGAMRPTFTFSATASTITMTAASCSLENILIVPSIDSVVSPIVVSAASCLVDVEVQDASATVECVNAILTTAAADNLTINLKYRGFSAGNACVNAIRLVGVDTARIYVDFYGVASTSIVEFHTTLCTDIEMTGIFYNDGTSLTKNVVDTVTGSKWSASGWDGEGSANFAGGDNAALAIDDVAAVSADTTAILVDTGTTLPATLAATPQCVVKTDGASLTGNDNLFVIAGGPVRCKIVGEVTTVLAGAANGDLQIVTTNPAATLDLNTAPVAVDNDAAGTIYYNVGATSVFTPAATLGGVLLDPVTVEETEFILGPGTVHFRSSAAQTGVIAWYITYTPLSPLSTVTAAA
jgi:hypothetical protein